MTPERLKEIRERCERAALYSNESLAEDDVRDLLAEVERLRAALEDIYMLTDGKLTTANAPAITRIARTALRGDGDGDAPTWCTNCHRAFDTRGVCACAAERSFAKEPKQ